MKTKQSRNYSFVIPLFCLLLTLFSAASFALAARSVPEASNVKADRVISNTHSELWPWSMLKESDSTLALDLIKDEGVLSKESINKFVKNTLLSSSHSTVPNSAIDATDFSAEMMITENDFYLWIKDKTITAYDNSEFVTGFFGFSGEYDICFSAYCIRKSALSEENVWSECTDEEIVEFLTYEDTADVYYDSPSEVQEDAEAYIRTDDGVYPVKLTLIDITVSYIDRIVTLSGFEGISNEVITSFADTVSRSSLKAYRNGELLMLYFDDIEEFKLYLFYDLGTQTYCGWIRN
ncbi:MAG: hypothetical protein IJD17_00220 [Clostridia bacterium]|nr:hypothetical protein [Clostridia bacterium]